MQDKKINNQYKPNFWIAVDWGTSTLRCWAMQGDQATRSAQSTNGMNNLDAAGFEPALLDIIDDWLPANQTTPVLACGMVGAKQGWVEAPYMQTPCAPSLKDATVIAPTTDTRIQVSIIPGISQHTPADVMRGEETLIAGLLVDDEHFSGAVCLPGTHCKWVNVDQGNIQQFSTVMTGELFDLLSTHSVLRFNTSDNANKDDQLQFNHAFNSAVTEYTESPASLTTTLFSIRAQALLQDTSTLASTARLSGLLIAADAFAMQSYWKDRPCMIVGKPGLANLYKLAIDTLNTKTHPQLAVKSMDNLALKGISRHARQTGIA